MAASSAASAQPPPDVPAGTAEPLANFLRTFSLWCRRGFADRLPINSAVSGILLQARDNPSKVFRLEVDSAGALHATSVPLGSGP